MEKRVIAIIGPTASGKGTLARALAHHIQAEVISMDSMKVYRSMNIGTATPSATIQADLPHHLVDVADHWESFSAARYVELADAAVDEIHERGRPAVAVGGTILYFKCWYEGIFEGPPANPEIRARIRERARAEGLDVLHVELAQVDPEAAERIHRNDLRRIERALEVYELTGRPISELQRQWSTLGPRRSDWHWTLIGLRRERDDCNRRINLRVKRMIDAGLVEEARRIWDDPRGISTQAVQAVGYAELFEHFSGRLTQQEAIEQIKIHSRQLAKHQRTWLKRLADIHWIEATGVDDTTTLLPEALEILGHTSSR